MIQFVDAQGKPISNTAAPVGNAAKAAADDEDEEDEEDDMPPKKGKGKKAANNQQVNNATDVKGYIASSPPEIQEVLNNGLASYNEEKNRIVDSLTKNNVFSKEELSSKPLGELRKLAKLAAVNAPSQHSRHDYSGMGPVAMEAHGEQEVLALPTMNFSKETVTATK